MNKLDAEYQIKFIIHVDDTKPCYTIRTRCRKGERFNAIVNILPEATVREQLTSPEDLTFVHKGLFIAKTTTLVSAAELIELSLADYTKLFNKTKRVLKRPSIGIGAAALLGTLGYLWYRSSD